MYIVKNIKSIAQAVINIITGKMVFDDNIADDTNSAIKKRDYKEDDGFIYESHNTYVVIVIPYNVDKKAITDIIKSFIEQFITNIRMNKKILEKVICVADQINGLVIHKSIMTDNLSNEINVEYYNGENFDILFDPDNMFDCSNMFHHDGLFEEIAHKYKYLDNIPTRNEDIRFDYRISYPLLYNLHNSRKDYDDDMLSYVTGYRNRTSPFKNKNPTCFKCNSPIYKLIYTDQTMKNNYCIICAHLKRARNCMLDLVTYLVVEEEPNKKPKNISDDDFKLYLSDVDHLNIYNLNHGQFIVAGDKKTIIVSNNHNVHYFMPKFMVEDKEIVYTKSTKSKK